MKTVLTEKFSTQKTESEVVNEMFTLEYDGEKISNSLS